MNEQKRTLAEQMAVAVLKGDWAAACALADLLADGMARGTEPMPPIKSIDAKGLRAVFSTHPSLGGDVLVDWESLQREWHNWVHHGAPLALLGMQMELYSLPGLPEPDWVFGAPEPGDPRGRMKASQTRDGRSGNREVT